MTPVNRPVNTDTGPANTTAMNEREHRQTHAAQIAFVRSMQRLFVEELLRLPLDSGLGIDKLRHRIKLPPAVNVNTIGSLVRQLSDAGLIEPVSMRPTHLPTGRGHLLREWRLVSHAAGLEWLRTHPALPMPDDTQPVQPADDVAMTPSAQDAKGDA